ncbi:MAG: hypothetical protein MUC59_17465 [Saprospiraceae bacterium]|nr:hypothetical protein [Saprospiraceae bacterium]
MSKVYERGTSDSDARTLWAALKIDVHPLSESQADAAARLRPVTRSLGLSLGDRCCLALASELKGASVVTADRAWKAIKGFRFTFVR